MKMTLLLVIAILVSIVGILLYNNKQITYKLDRSRSNEKALLYNMSNIENTNRELKLTVDQLIFTNDSIINKLDSVRKALDIKDKNIKNLEYVLSQSSKQDTIYFKDTIFINSTINIDTTLQDNWYKVRLGLKYPNIIEINPEFTSEKFIITSYKRETVNNPSKCKVIRLFQKKHNIVEVNVIEQSPYIKNKETRFIEVVR